ncbi:MAG: carboxylating nicotinate-nucleotide diphosphorylase [Verrucomicrobia bacterium]|nr:carboxylating nicotinate-nucleotide diphosphorylase [Verrucomicrobiota bacterium]
MSELPNIGDDARVRDLVRRALKEDIGSGDATSLSVVADDRTAKASIVAREKCVLSGLPLAQLVFQELSPDIDVKVESRDGSAVASGDAVMTIRGPARNLLTGERTALNFMQRMSGIATLTRAYVDIASRYDVAVLDTRKTTPTLRVLEKYAVLCGGGKNHRFGLYDKIMMKDNHLAFMAGGGEGRIAEAVRNARQKFPGIEVEIEVDSPAQMSMVLDQNPEWVLLDNMSPDELEECVRVCNGRARLEASGGISLETLAAICATGIDAVSVGQITHSARSIDLAMDFC